MTFLAHSVEGPKTEHHKGHTANVKTRGSRTSRSSSTKRENDITSSARHTSLCKQTTPGSGPVPLLAWRHGFAGIRRRRRRRLRYHTHPVVFYPGRSVNRLASMEEGKGWRVTCWGWIFSCTLMSTMAGLGFFDTRPGGKVISRPGESSSQGNGQTSNCYDRTSR
jgi:hypothetical protein